MFILASVNGTHVIGGYISIVETNGTTVTFRFTEFREIGSAIDFGGGHFDFGDGKRLEGDFETTRTSTSGVEVVSFDVNHTYSSPGKYTASFTEPLRTEHIRNVNHSLNASFYVDIAFNLDPFLPNNHPGFQIDHLLKASGLSNYEHAIYASDPDGDLLTFSLVVPKVSASESVQEYDFAGMSIDPFTGNLLWQVPPGTGDHELYLFAIRVSEYRQFNDDWVVLSSSIIDFNLEVHHHHGNTPSIEGWGDRICFDESPYLEISSLESEFELNIAAPFLNLTSGAPADDLHGTSQSKDTIFNFSINHTAMKYNYGFVGLSNEESLVSRNLFYTTGDCRELEALQNLITKVSPEERVAIYPNPSQGVFQLDRGSARSMKITTLDGREIVSQRLDHRSSVVDLRARMEPGIYFVHFFDRDSNLIRINRIVVVP